MSSIPAQFLGRRGVRYLSQFKPRAPYELPDGLVVVPAGWTFIAEGAHRGLRMCRSYVVGPPEIPDTELWSRFRRWVIFDSFAMMTGGASLFDEAVHFPIEELRYSVESGTPGDEGDTNKAEDYDDISRIFVHAPFATAGLTPRSYGELYAAYLALPDDKSEALEWLVGSPPSIRRTDAFFGMYWQVLHLTILLEHLVGPPWVCRHTYSPCPACSRTPVAHQMMSRARWLRGRLMKYVRDRALVEEYAEVIEAAFAVRHKMAHSTHFDRSVMPAMRYHLERREYDAADAVNTYKSDSTALTALVIALRHIAHRLLLDVAFGTKSYRKIHTLTAVQMGGPPMPEEPPETPSANA